MNTKYIPEKLPYFYPGCHVKAKIHTIPSDPPDFNVRILAIIERKFRNPLIIGVDPTALIFETDYDPKIHRTLATVNDGYKDYEIKVFDAGYIIEVYHMPMNRIKHIRYNPFTDEKQFRRNKADSRLYLCTDKKGIWYGPLFELIHQVLSTSNIEWPIWAYINMSKAYIMFEKHGLGLIRECEHSLGQGMYYVRVKYFKKWVRANWHHFIPDKDIVYQEFLHECEEEERMAMKDFEDDYMKDFDKEDRESKNEPVPEIRGNHAQPI